MTTEALPELHDATLLSIHFQWEERSCELFFAGAPDVPGPFSLYFSGVTELHVPAALPWGPSVSVLDATAGAGVYSLQMQSGDTIRLVATNYVSKRTAGDMLGSSDTRSTSGRLTRR